MTLMMGFVLLQLTRMMREASNAELDERSRADEAERINDELLAHVGKLQQLLQRTRAAHQRERARASELRTTEAVLEAELSTQMQEVQRCTKELQEQRKKNGMLRTRLCRRKAADAAAAAHETSAPEPRGTLLCMVFLFVCLF